MKTLSADSREKGAALVVGIVLLVVSTLLALVAMQSSIFQERMASNQINKTISLMAAEFGAGHLLEAINSVGYDPSQPITQWDVGNSNAPLSAGDGNGFFWVELLNHVDEESEPPTPLRVAVHGVSRTAANTPDLGKTELHLSVTEIPPNPADLDCGGDTGPSDDAAINFINPLNEYRAPNSNSFTVTGAQEDGETAGPAIGVSNTTDRDALINELGPDGVDRLHNYDGGIVAKDYGEFWNSPSTLQQFVDLVCADPNARCGTSVAANTTGRGKNKAAAMVPKITVVRGDATVDFGGGAVGAGLLIVEGDLYMNGNPSWDGIIITLGGTVDVSGGGNGVFNGTIYALDINTSADPWTLNNEGIDWITRGGGTAAYNHNCALVEASLDLLEEADFDADGNPNARALFGDNHGCGPGGNTSPGGEICSEEELLAATRYILQWVEVLQ